MLFKDILAQLNPPIDLGAVDAELIAVDASGLDKVQASADQLLSELLPDRAQFLLSAWERVYDLHPSAAETISERRRKVLIKYATVGGLSRPYFIALASLLGQTITIEGYSSSRCGSMVCGDYITVGNIDWMWTVRGLDSQGGYAQCGDFFCGERLSCPAVSIEDFFNDLRPAHSIVNFVYNT